MDHHRIIGKVLQKGGDDANNDHGRENDADGGDDTADNALAFCADKGCGVDGDNAGGALADCVVVGEFFFGGPAAVVDQLTLEDRQHRIAAAEGQSAESGEQ